MKPLVIIAGPTACGKTELSLKLAKAVGGEILSGDSMQVYRGMDIGTAKIAPDEREGIAHHLIDIREPSEEFDVRDYQAEAKAAIEEITARGKIPILVGGTGFYLHALLYDTDFTETDEKHSSRKIWEEQLLNGGEAAERALWEELRRKDPDAAEQIHPHNHKRLLRALEFYEMTGSPISAHNEREREKDSPYQFCFFVLNRDRGELYRRIDQRVDEMMNRGLLDEVRRLAEDPGGMSRTARAAIGYKELLDALDGSCTVEEAVENVKLNTRHYAKRQVTWMKRERDTVWIDMDQMSKDEALELMLREMRGRGIIRQ